MSTKGLMIASAAATLLLSGAVTARAADAAGGDQVICDGINACKGQGHTKTTAADCKAKGGKVAEPSK